MAQAQIQAPDVHADANLYDEGPSWCDHCSQELDHAVKDLRQCEATSQFKPEWYQSTSTLFGVFAVGLIAGIIAGAASNH